MRNPTLLATITMALLGACVGGIDTPPGGDDDDEPPVPGETARALFDRTVATPLAGLCASCHVGSTLSSTNMFLGPDGMTTPAGITTAYETLIKDRAVNGGFNPEAATLLLKGLHEGPAWTTAQAEKITTWLRAELTARGPISPDNGTTGTTNPRVAAQMFVSCMSVSLTEFNATRPFIIAAMNSQLGNCASCHGEGAAGLYARPPNEAKAMFDHWMQEVYFYGAFTAARQTDNTYKVVAAETKICNKGREKDNNLGTHPDFNCQQNNSTALNALKLFAQQVQAKVDAKDPLCPTPADFAAPTL